MGQIGHAVNSDEVVSDTINIIAVFGGAVIGALVGLVIAVLVFALAKWVTRIHRLAILLFNRVRRAWPITGLMVGAYIGLRYSDTAAVVQQLPWLAYAEQTVLILAIFAVTWLAVTAANVLEDATTIGREDATDGRTRRVQTQAQVMRRIIQTVLILIGIAAAIFTFPTARVAAASVLASAGIVSIVATLAAQSTLANLFAGLQLALSDAIRVGDIVVVPGLGAGNEQGTIEEITLTYVVVRLWDDRRILAPSTDFTQKRFENWSRRDTQMLGDVKLRLDFSAPVTAIRAEVDRILSETDLWDGRSASVQVTDSDAETITLRVTATAANSGVLWDLKSLLRERLYEWLVLNAPYALPRKRYAQQQVQTVERDLSREQIADFAEELLDISGYKLGKGPSIDGERMVPIPESADDGDGSGKVSLGVQKCKGTTGSPAISDPNDPAHLARIRAAQKRAKAAIRRRSLQKKLAAAAESAGNPPGETPGTEATMLLQEPIKPEGSVTDTGSVSATFYSGGADADERMRRAEGPGQDVFDERDRRIEENK